MKKTILSLTALLLGALSMTAQAQDTPAFPTAEGFGKWVTGGRGGRVVEVTNLDDYNDYAANGAIEDSIPGSFRWALCQFKGEPITVVFRVSGTIHLHGDLRRNRSNMTIAGQTAPGDGICIRGAKVNFGGSSNIIVRHIRFRIGLSEADGTFVAGGSLGYENGSNAIFDHCTFGWSGEENATIYDDHYITVQWCLVHEGLYCAGHAKGVRGYGSQWGGSPATYHHNALAHNYSRSPRLNGASNSSGDNKVFLDYINNVNYNWGKQNSCYGGENEASKKGYHQCNFEGNYYKPGPASPSKSYFISISNNRSGKTSYGAAVWYFNGNVMEGSSATDDWSNVEMNSKYTLAEQKSETRLEYAEKDYSLYKMTAEPAATAFKKVIAGAGAFPRDAVDTRIFNEIYTGTASGRSTQEKYVSAISGTDTTWTANPMYGRQIGIIDAPEGAGGYPEYNTYNQITDADHDGMDDAWETANGLDPNNAEDRNFTNKDGYTALEVYINSLCGEESDKTFTGVLSVKAMDLTITPTLAEEKLSVNAEAELQSAAIFNNAGSLVKRANLKNTNIVDVKDLPAGNYVISVSAMNGHTETAKFIKK